MDGEERSLGDKNNTVAASFTMGVHTDGTQQLVLWFDLCVGVSVCPILFYSPSFFDSSNGWMCGQRERVGARKKRGHVLCISITSCFIASNPAWQPQCKQRLS